MNSPTRTRAVYPNTPDGTPVLFDPKARERVVQALRSGLSLSVAASLVGLDRAAIRRHRKQNREFDTACAVAVAEYEASLLGSVNAGCDDPKLALEVLSRRFPQRWSQRLELRSKGDDDEDREADDASEMSVDELARLAGGE